jgi:hypothetical protein
MMRHHTGIQFPGIKRTVTMSDGVSLSVREYGPRDAAAGHMLLDEAPHVISNAIIGVIGAHTTGAMRRRITRSYDAPEVRQSFPLQEVS